jgi:hypothetical protein
MMVYALEEVGRRQGAPGWRVNHPNKVILAVDHGLGGDRIFFPQYSFPLEFRYADYPIYIFYIKIILRISAI